MRLEPLYRLTFEYSGHWDADAGGVLHSPARRRGSLRRPDLGLVSRTNDSRRRPDGTFEPDFHGVVETDDGAAILFHLTGYGWPDESRIVATLKHVCSDERYAWLGRTLCVVTGQLRGREVVLDVAELVWEPLT